MLIAKMKILTVVAIGLMWVNVNAQDIKIDVTKRGTSDFFINIEVHQATILDIMAVLATQTEFALDIASPEESRVLEANKIDISRKQIILQELVQLLGMSCGLFMETLGSAQKIAIRALPKADDKDSDEFFREQSLDAVFSAYGGDDNAENEVEFLLRTASLHEAGGKMGQAYNAYERFLTAYGSHERYAEVTLRAAEAAIKANLSEKARVRVDDFLSKEPDHRDTGKALILGAKAKLMTNDLRGALALYKTAIQYAKDRRIDDRDGLIAEFYVAELHHKNGNNEAAIKMLEQIEWSHDARHNRDLLDQVWLYLGICRRASGNKRDAIHDLNLAIFTCKSPKLRIRTLLLSSATYLEVKNPFFALNAARAAVALDAQGRDLFESLVLQGKAYRGLFLHERARSVLLDAVMQSPKLLPDEKERKERTTATMREIGDALFEDSRYQEALLTFQTIFDSATRQKLQNNKDFSDEFIAELRYMIARCQKRLGEFKAALKTLDGITRGVGSEAFLKDLRQLRGDCFMRLEMFEQAIRTWNEGDSR